MFATTLYLVFFGALKSSASALMISTFLRAGFSLRVGIKSLSSSMAVVFFACFASSSVRMPRPGPISITWSFEVTFAVLIIFATMALDWRKFWPSDFFALCVMGGGL